MHGHAAFDNANTQYTLGTPVGLPAPTLQFLIAQANEGVGRHEASQPALNYLKRYFSPSGSLGMPVITLDNVWDPAVPAFHGTLLLQAGQAAGATDMLLQRLRAEVRALRHLPVGGRAEPGRPCGMVPHGREASLLTAPQARRGRRRWTRGGGIRRPRAARNFQGREDEDGTAVEGGPRACGGRALAGAPALWLHALGRPARVADLPVAHHDGQATFPISGRVLVRDASDDHADDAEKPQEVSQRTPV